MVMVIMVVMFVMRCALAVPVVTVPSALALPRWAGGARGRCSSPRWALGLALPNSIICRQRKLRGI